MSPWGKAPFLSPESLETVLMRSHFQRFGEAMRKVCGGAQMYCHYASRDARGVMKNFVRGNLAGNVSSQVVRQRPGFTKN